MNNTIYKLFICWYCLEEKPHVTLLNFYSQVLSCSLKVTNCLSSLRLLSSTTSSRRTIFTVRISRSPASLIRFRPTFELAAFCTNQSPAFSAARSRSASSAVNALTIRDSCSASPSGTGNSRRLSARMYSRQLPHCSGSRQRSPTRKSATANPVCTIRPTPSTPGICGNATVRSSPLSGCPTVQ